MSFEEIRELMKPLFLLEACDQISYTKLGEDWRRIVAKLYETNSPVLVNLRGHKLLICDPNTFNDLEIRRRTVFQGLKTLEEVLQTSKVEFPDERIKTLEHLESQIAREKHALKELKWNQKQTSKKLIDMQAKADALTSELKRTEILNR